MREFFFSPPPLPPLFRRVFLNVTHQRAEWRGDAMTYNSIVDCSLCRTKFVERERGGCKGSTTGSCPFWLVASLGIWMQIQSSPDEFCNTILRGEERADGIINSPKIR